MRINGIAAADRFKALADSTRLRIVNLLREGSLCVCNIEQVLEISQTSASRHLAKLQAAGILESERHAQWVYYRISAQFLRDHEALMTYLHREADAEPQLQQDQARLAQHIAEGTLCAVLDPVPIPAMRLERAPHAR
ncbi:MAG: ArsR family transcriptional regulator [Spirochaetaceae bacterium]|nr:MAG: ArsR family transcriptional regulator [Spirochaetaceae bacterium]